MTNSNGTIAPKTPNCARLWIICGIPSLGPCAEWEAMKIAPIIEPSRMESALQNRLRPRLMGSTPAATVVMLVLAPNHTKNSERGSP
ncbi:hypothetical protein D9M73_227260 [compost metagenome]